jgi:hypothetical protein
MHQVPPLLLKQNQSLQNSTRSLHQIRTLKFWEFRSYLMLGALTPRTAPFSVLILHTMHKYETKIATNTNKEKEIKSAYGFTVGN